MMEEPYRWLEAIGHRREYVREQLKGGSPVLAARLTEGVLLVGVGAGQSKVFELFDRQALAGLGHPADLEKLRQTAIDTAHIEAFTRAPEDVSLRRLVAFGLSPHLKSSFEQIFGAPVLGEFILAEVGDERERDLLVRLHFDGTFELEPGPVAVAASAPEAERAARSWLGSMWRDDLDRGPAAELLLQTWGMLEAQQNFETGLPGETERREGWRQRLGDRQLELGWLRRDGRRRTRYERLTREELSL
jgi:proteasome alpha subunit